MRLNPDLIRDILLVVEDNTDLHRNADSQMIYDKLLGKYSQDEIDYHVYQAREHGLFIKAQFSMNGYAFIPDLSPEGHKFLSNIRNDNNWAKTKSIAKSAGSLSLDVLKDVSASVILGLIQSQMNLPPNP
jgi:hypothetical protein